MTAPSLLCTENTVFPFRWRDDGRQKGSWGEGGGGGGGGGRAKDGPHDRLQTSKKILVLIFSQKRRVRDRQ